jgi:hypothetical protein
MLIDFQLAQTGVILRVKIRNSSVSTGAGLTGLTNTSTGLIISTIADVEATATPYTVAASNVQAVATLGTYAAPAAGKVSFSQVDATNHPGIYEIQIANARFAVTNAKSLLVSITGATNAADCDVVIPLRTVNPYAADFALSAAPLLANPTANTWGESLFLADAARGRRGTAQGGTSTTITLDAGAASNANSYVGDGIILYGGTGGGYPGVGQVRTIVAYNTSTKVATVDRAWTTTPDATSTFITLPTQSSNVAMWDFSLVPSPSQAGVPITDPHYFGGTASPATAGFVGVDWAHINAPTTVVALSGTTISTGQAVASVSGAVGSVTGLTTATIATAVWQDTTAGDFTVAGSIGKSLFTSGAVPGAAGGLFIAGTNAATSVTTAFTTTFTGNLTGNVGGNLTGSAGSIAGVTFPSNFGTMAIDSNGYVRLSGPFKTNTASGFEFAMFQISSPTTGYTAGSVTATREIAGTGTTTAAGTVTQIGSTNRYYFAGAQADFNGANVTFTFAASGAIPVTVSINPQP